MSKKLLISVCLLLIVSTGVHAQSIWNRDHLNRVKAQIDAPVYKRAYDKLIKKAEGDIQQKPVSVMMKEITPPSGTKHDYSSLARYAWPDPSKSDGLPYITRDGESNPELAKYDRNRLGMMSERVVRLALAYFFSNDEKYARKATEMLRVWFLNKETRMNPNLKYAQCVPGKFKGRSYGVIDAYSFVPMLDAVQLLKDSRAFTHEDDSGLKQWFKELLKWLTTDKQALQERAAKNNHGTAYDVQVAAFARYVGDDAFFMDILESFPTKRIKRQIEPDGRQPQELRRTLAFGYSQFNLHHIIDLMLMAKNAGMPVDNYASVDGHSLYAALDFLQPYMGKTVQEWPWKQISQWEEKQQDLALDYYRAWLLSPSRMDYLRVYRNNAVSDRSFLFALLYEKPTKADNAMTEAESQLVYALEYTKSARESRQSPNACVPATLNKDGSLKLVPPRDWRSGFFAGTLWQLYQYSHQQRWQKVAADYTWLLKDIKDYRGTHDLGFMINNSFGKGWETTGEKAYRDVVIDAAKSLVTRFNPTVGCIRSWDHNKDLWKYPVIIDNMMNLEMLFDATWMTGDSSYWKIAVSHADTTMKHHFRNDHSSYHVVDYDPATGAVRRQMTHQGYSDDSFWSRGQGWGLYGYTLCYRYTREPRYLTQAQDIARFILALPNVPEDGIYYWDMKDPRIPHVPRDASAAAIIASALYELCTYVDARDCVEYKRHADKIVNSLIDHYQAPLGEAKGFLLLHSTGHLPAGNEIDVPLNYADYYYIEALMRKEKLEGQR